MTLRMRLFLNVGAIFLLVCILSYAIPNFLTQKEVKQAGEEVDQLVLKQEAQVYRMLSEIVRYNFEQTNEETLPALLREMALVAQRTVVFVGQGKLIGYDKTGNPFPVSLDSVNPAALTASQGEFVWRNNTYHYLKYHIDAPWESDLFVISLKTEMFSVIPLLNQLRGTIGREISLHLLGASLCIFALSLLVLSRTSKRITQPIAVLARAANALEAGKLEGVVLPTAVHHDEIAVLASSFEKMVIALKDREKIRGVLNKVVSKEIAAEILKGNIELGGEKRLATLLFSDIRGFTKMTGHMDPKEVIAMMNSYFTAMCHIIDRHGGVVDKFVGDEVMALYGAPLQTPKDALSALESAFEMVQSSPFPIGIGIHTGEMVAGNVGSETRLNYTVLGVNVNLAARLCQNAAPMQILVSEQTVQARGVQDAFAFEELAPMSFKGFDAPLKVFALKKNLRVSSTRA